MGPTPIRTAFLLTALLAVVLLELAAAYLGTRWQIPRIDLIAIARMAQTLALLTLTLVQAGSLRVFGLDKASILPGLKKGMAWSAGFAAAAALLFIGLYMAGQDPLALVRSALPEGDEATGSFFPCRWDRWTGFRGDFIQGNNLRLFASLGRNRGGARFHGGVRRLSSAWHSRYPDRGGDRFRRGLPHGQKPDGAHRHPRAGQPGDFFAVATLIPLTPGLIQRWGGIPQDSFAWQIRLTGRREHHLPLQSIIPILTVPDHFYRFESRSSAFIVARGGFVPC
jgi:hypothetical protein